MTPADLLPLAGGLLLFLVLAWLVFRFRDAGFTLLEGALLLLVAPLASFVDLPLAPVDGRWVGVNLGGAVVPLVVAGRVLATRRAKGWRVLVVAAVVGVASWRLGEVVPARGIVLTNLLWPVVLATALGFLLTLGRRKEAAPTAYAGGTIGVLVGLDVLLLPAAVAAVPRGTFLSVGGAGIGDAVFLLGFATVVLDLLLAALTGRR